jgi:hypothetical protein
MTGHQHLNRERARHAASAVTPPFAINALQVRFLKVQNLFKVAHHLVADFVITP